MLGLRNEIKAQHEDGVISQTDLGSGKQKKMPVINVVFGPLRQSSSIPVLTVCIMSLE